jgi:NAD(P)-dependent dehydrogenase (short-subunit alcohol dehydrogenase family)
MELGLKDKVALITGASRGIGAASAKALAYHGATVISLSRFPGYGFSAHAG